MTNRAMALRVMMVSLVVTGVAILAAVESVEARKIVADMVAINQPITFNRYGTADPDGMIYALRRDVVDAGGVSLASGGSPVPGAVRLRPGKRPRPTVLRVNVGDTLEIRFQNLLAPALGSDGGAGSGVSIRVEGLNPVPGSQSGGTRATVGPPVAVRPGGIAVYGFSADRQGTFLFHGGGVLLGTGSMEHGLYGAINVLPAGAEYYRAQVAREDLDLATAGRLDDGHPLIDYDAVYPAGHRLAGLPVLNMLKGDEIVHSDLSAIITGPERGPFPAGTMREVRASAPPSDEPRSRDEPFREFTILVHDDMMADQAFPEFGDPELGYTLRSVRDGAGVNYGSNGLGSAVLAQRRGLGPARDCVECEFGEFFSSSWVTGDPALLVDVPSGAVDPKTGSIPQAPGARVALYPDDPSNVFHGYMGDRVTVRNLNAGKERVVLHAHGHQWLANPEDDRSKPTDGALTAPGMGVSLEFTGNGGGNRNLSVGDALLRSEDDTRFARGLWGVLRIHDVFEAGTLLDGSGRPAAFSRALPDGEIARGTPIPAVVPIPGRAMAPMPGAARIASGQVVVDEAGRNPGYPFFIPGRAGHRAPQPPLDLEDDGGLPRHVVVGGTAQSIENRLDFSKILQTAEARELPGAGTGIERVAMTHHAARFHPSFTPEGFPAEFRTNGRPPVPGAPYADPCLDDFGGAAGFSRTVKIAAMQHDLVMNKAGWHQPQARVLALREDARATLDGTRPPEPLVFRANTGDCVTLHVTNLLPNAYESDDARVRTPTGTLGQHPRLVKFDLTASDGAAAGFNYEDGTFSPREVEERINAINLAGGIQDREGDGGPRKILTVAPHPFFGTPGAQTTIQRWFVDGVPNNDGVNRTLGVARIDDPFDLAGGSGLHGALLAEPEGSTWRDSETGRALGGRPDGGPTSWRADILAADGTEGVREFALFMGDAFAAYPAGKGGTGDDPVADPAFIINGPAMEPAGFPEFERRPDVCPGGAAQPCPEAVPRSGVGTRLVNYRNEPLALRIYDPKTGGQAAGEPGDLSFAYRSDVTRAMAELNGQPTRPGMLTRDVRSGDPATPMMRAYAGDRVRVRMMTDNLDALRGVTIHGVRWPDDPSRPDSHYRNARAVSGSEDLEFEAPSLPGGTPVESPVDHLYQAGTSVDDQWNGTWGLLRTYNRARSDLKSLPGSGGAVSGETIGNMGDFNGVCPRSAPVRRFNVTAVAAAQVLPGGSLVYNPRRGDSPSAPGPLADPGALLLFNSRDLVFDPVSKQPERVKPGVPVEPLVLRAGAGECVEVGLRNALPPEFPELGREAVSLPPLVDGFNAGAVTPSMSVGLHPQLVTFDVSSHDGANVGLNAVRVQTAPPGGSVFYRWYAGVLEKRGNALVATPVEFGALNLIPSDPVLHTGRGLAAALVIEPKGAGWTTEPDSRATATVTVPGGGGRPSDLFREFVLFYRDGVSVRSGNGAALPSSIQGNHSGGGGLAAFNYGTEPLWFRGGPSADAMVNGTDGANTAAVAARGAPGGGRSDLATPVFSAPAGTPVRLRLLQPGGRNGGHAFTLDGHSWRNAPDADGSRSIGVNPSQPVEWILPSIIPADHRDLLIDDGAGGPPARPGDYLYRDPAPDALAAGLWGILRVTP